MRRAFVFTAVVLLTAVNYFSQTQNTVAVTEGTLYAVSKKGDELGSCPLARTDVRVDITGFLARTTLVQQFRNTFSEPIEAVYVFPMSNDGAVDEMKMTIGERIIRGTIMRTEEARAVYEKARSDGKSASLLQQERPNAFTQSVANIPPGETIKIEISYVETLKYDSGTYEYVFPLTVGPRYTPATPQRSESGAKPAPVPSPVYAATRSGADVSVEVNLNAGFPIEKVESKQHEVAVSNEASTAKKITLAAGPTIPNKDFVLRYELGGDKISEALMTHRIKDEPGYFMYILQPPDAPRVEDITPKEIVFVLDTSGSMSGFPIETAKSTIRKSLKGLNPNDRFNIITFAGETAILFDAPVPATPENLDLADKFVEKRSGGGGTEMMKAVRAAFAPSEAKSHLRIVCFLTDGFVNNEREILKEIDARRNARVFSLGIGTSVNRYLLDQMAQAGAGEVDYVLSEKESDGAAERFYQRVRSPLLTDLSLDWSDLSAAEILPKRLGDLFSAKPVIITGRFPKTVVGNAVLTARLAGVEYKRMIPVNFPEAEPGNEVVATIWARRKIAELSMELGDTLNEAENAKAKEQIIQLSLKHRILTEFTSFVAVEETIVNQNGKPVRVNVPVQIPDGLNAAQSRATPITVFAQLQTPPVLVTGGGSGTGDGTGNISSFSVPQANVQLIVPAPGLTADKPETQPKNGGTVEEIVKRLEKHQKSLTSVRASVEAVEKQNDGTTVTSEGNLTFLKPNSLRVDWMRPAIESIAVAESKLVTFRPESKDAFVVGVGGSYRHELTLGFTIGTDLAKNYEISLAGTETLPNGLVGAHLVLTPKDKGDYKSISLWVEDTGAVIKFAVLRDSGKLIEVSFTNIQLNPNIDPSEFRITMPAGTKIIKN